MSILQHVNIVKKFKLNEPCLKEQGEKCLVELEYVNANSTAYQIQRTCYKKFPLNWPTHKL